MDAELPLNYIVAQGLGWKWWRFCDEAILLPPGYWEPDDMPGLLPDGPGEFRVVDGSEYGHPAVPDYENDWAALGPVIEECGIGLQCLQTTALRNQPERTVTWVAFTMHPTSHAFSGPTVGSAVCNLIASRVAVGEVFK